MSVNILIGDCREKLRFFPDGYFHCCVTSWPFWGLRDYGIPPTVWGGDPECEHVWGEHHVGRVTGGGDRPPDNIWPGGPSPDSQPVRSFCLRCGAWLGCFGLEPTPELYVQHGVEVSREVWRVLRDDGTMWLNLGDCYMGSGQGWKKDDNNLSWKRRWLDEYGVERPPTAVYNRSDIKPKDLVGIPWAVAFALRDDGWYLRQAIPWVKANPMPESIDDRPTTSHEYLFLFSKSRRYYYDKVAIFESCASGPSDIKKMVESKARIGGKHKDEDNVLLKASSLTNIGAKRAVGDPAGRNRRTADWWHDSLDLLIEQHQAYLAHLEYIREEGGMLLDADGQPLGLMVNPEGFPGDHYAVFPTRLVEPCVKAGTSERGACPECGGPWERVVEVSGGAIGKSWHNHEDDLGKGRRAKVAESKGGHGHSRKTIGFRPTCSCYDDRYRSEFPRARSARKRWQQDMADRWWPRVRQRLGKDDWPTVPCRVLDHFGGAGTTGLVAAQLWRDAVVIDIKPDYGMMAYERIKEDELPLFDQVDLEA